MNSVDNIVDTINILDDSLKLLHGNAINLVQLTEHQIYGPQIIEVLDGIQEYQKKLASVTADVLAAYENRYSKHLSEVDKLTNELLGDISAL